MDVGRLRIVHRVEVVVAVDRVQIRVVSELLRGGGRMFLQADDSVKVILPFGGRQSSPLRRSISMARQSMSIESTNHSFLTQGFSQDLPSLFSAVPIGEVGAAMALPAEAKTQAVVEAKRIMFD